MSKPFLMGTETEYSVSGRLPTGLAIQAEEVYALLNEALRHERLWMQDVNGGRAVYLQHGGRFYMDSGGHPEYATPEVFNPVQAAAYDKAGEHLLTVARAHVLRHHPGMRVTVTKNNIGPILPDRVAWGCHESHTCWQPLDKAAPMMIPHLVSRTVYAGAGCLSARPGGIGFELSQRARHIVQVTGHETTSNRPIFGTRLRKAADFSRAGWFRVHLITKDSQRSPFGIYLTFGTTGLLFLLINEGRKVGEGLALAEPVKALQAISLDPSLRVRVRLADGRQLTALEIQESYLGECEKALKEGWLPDWAHEVAGHWRATLEALARDPLSMARRLDPYTKCLIYEHELRRGGYTWAEVHAALRILDELRVKFPDVLVRAVLAESPEGLPADLRPKFDDAMTAAQASISGMLDRLRFAVRLQALELNYHELGGLYDQLADAGQVESVVLSREDVERASREPPPGGRAALRAEGIRDKREPGWVCDWRYLFHSASATFVDLRDPFGSEKRIVSREQFERDDRTSDIDLMEIYHRLTRR